MADLKPPVRVGIIGCGQIAQHHLRRWRELPDASVVACADIDRGAADRTAQAFSVPKVFYTAAEMLRSCDLDAVDVCVHNNLHASAVAAVLESGRHCFCEKPMAGRWADARSMRQAAERAGRMLHVQINTLFEDETRVARELVDGGALGRIYHARTTGWRRRGRPFVDGYGRMPFVQSKFSGGGALLDMGVYHVSRLLYLLGNPRLETVTGARYAELPMDAARREQSGFDVEELAAGFARYEGGLSLDIVEAWAVQLGPIEGACLVGTEGGLRFDPLRHYRTVADVDVDCAIDASAQRYRWNKLRGEEDLYTDSQAHWLAALLGRAPLLPTAAIAENHLLLAEGLYLSARLGREVTATEIMENAASAALEL